MNSFTDFSQCTIPILSLFRIPENEHQLSAICLQFSPFMYVLLFA